MLQVRCALSCGGSPRPGRVQVDQAGQAEILFASRREAELFRQKFSGRLLSNQENVRLSEPTRPGLEMKPGLKNVKYNKGEESKHLKQEQPQVLKQKSKPRPGSQPGSRISVKPLSSLRAPDVPAVLVVLEAPAGIVTRLQVLLTGLGRRQQFYGKPPGILVGALLRYVSCQPLNNKYGFLQELRSTFGHFKSIL